MLPHTKNIDLVIFDLDGTLTPSKSAMDAEMSALLGLLLAKKKVAVISGGAFSQFKNQFLVSLSAPRGLFLNLFLFPTSGASFFRYENGEWVNVYEEKLTTDERDRIFAAFPKAIQEAGVEMLGPLHGDQLEDRGTQVTFSALGQDAPIELKSTWDPDQRIRLRIKDFLSKYLPDLEVRVGGSTSIDVTKKGIDKKHGILQMEKYLGIPKDRMFFVGDALYPGGNDYAAVEAGVHTAAVSGPVETKRIVRDILQ